MSAGSTPDTGMVETAGRGWSWAIDPLEHWTAVPVDRSEPPEVIDAWEHALADSVLTAAEAGVNEALGPDEVLSGDDREQLVRQVVESVESVRTFAENVPPGMRVVAAVGLVDRGPVPVLVSVAASESGASDDDLMEVLGATGDNPVNPPKIEYLDLADGDGIRVTRIDLDTENGAAWLSIGVGRRTEHTDAVVDTVLLWRTQDLTIAQAMSEALDDLLPAVRITRSET